MLTWNWSDVDPVLIWCWPDVDAVDPVLAHSWPGDETWWPDIDLTLCWSMLTWYWPGVCCDRIWRRRGWSICRPSRCLLPPTSRPRRGKHMVDMLGISTCPCSQNVKLVQVHVGNRDVCTCIFHLVLSKLHLVRKDIYSECAYQLASDSNESSLLLSYRLVMNLWWISKSFHHTE